MVLHGRQTAKVHVAFRMNRASLSYKTIIWRWAIGIVSRRRSNMADKGLAEHHAAVTVDAPVQQVYELFTHFNDFPKFMSFVKEVTYYDNQRSHWVAEVV